MDLRACPLEAPDKILVRQYLAGLSLNHLITLTEDVFRNLSSSEQVTYSMLRFCSGYSDHDGRIKFLITLINDKIISPLRVPTSASTDPKLNRYFKQPTYDYYIPIAQEQHQESQALTDDVEIVPADALSVSNPRWECVDKEKNADSTSIATVGDTIALLVDVTGYPNGAPVQFDIFDTSCDPAFRINTVNGKNDNGTAKITWTISDPNERKDALKLAFEASARSKSSGRTPIDPHFGKIYLVTVKDEEENPLEGIRVEFTVPGEEPVIVLTDKNGIAEQPATDPSVNADVRILWKMSEEETESAPYDNEV